MQLSVKGLAVAIGLLWGLMFLVVGLANLAFPGYGTAFMNMGESIYPGYHGPNGIGSVIVATLYAFVDGLIGGGLIAWFYNKATA